jgi:hypothetical protein
MALSPADFYAYSRATGAPLPEDPEERAAMAPEVLEFRRNQLKPQEERSNPLAALGTTALGLGALAGVGFGARALMRRGQQIPKGPAKSATAGVRQVNLADMEQAVRRVASETPVSTPPPAPSKVTGRSVMPTEEEAFTQYRRQLETELPEPTAEELNFPPATSRIYGVGYRDRQPEPGYRSAALAAFEKKYPPSAEVQAARRAAAQQDLLNAAASREVSATSLTDIQKTQAPVTTDQFINAVESGEDQTTGRLVKQLNIADPWGESTIPPEVINPQQTTPLPPAAAVSPREKAQAFLQTRFEELGSVMPGRYRRERAMGQDPAIVEAMELYASTGDPSVLSRLSETPSSPLTVIPRVQTELREKEEIPTRMLFKPTGQGEFIDDLFEKDIALTNKISNLGVAKQNIVDRLEEIDQLEPQLRFAAADEPGQGGYYTKMLNKMLFERQSLNPDVINADLGDAIAERNFVRSQMESLESLGSKYQMIPRQEGVRPFFELDPVTNEPIAETLEIRSGRPSVQLEEQKTGGGRYYSAYDPETQVGSSIGIYGIEPRNFPIADPELRPTVLQREETKMAIRRKPQEGEALKTYMEEARRAETATPEQKLSSVNMSQAILKAAKQQATRNPRGGILPDEITTLRRQMAQPAGVEQVFTDVQETVNPIPPQQLGLKGVTGYSARQLKSPADLAAEQLENYMSKLQRGRSTPLTSEVVIQPRLV